MSILTFFMRPRCIEYGLDDRTVLLILVEDRGISPSSSNPNFTTILTIFDVDVRFRLQEVLGDSLEDVLEEGLHWTQTNKF